MFLDPSSRNEINRYLALAQVGMEMAGPIGIGFAVDYFFNCSPWGIIVGAVLGLVGGIAHLVQLSNRQDRPDSSKPQRGGS
jgi:F0F1-type ATP synthase assembly protein I